jgi:hypothetical protein
VVTLTPGRFTPREIVPRTHTIWSWIGPTNDLEILDKTEISFTYRESKKISAVVQPVA